MLHKRLTPRAQGQVRGNYTSTGIISCCKYMKNNAFAQVHRAFYSLIAPNKNTPMRSASACPPQSSTRIRSGGGRRWSACIKRWNVATLSPRRRGDTARPISTQPEESAGRLPGWIKIPSRPGTCIRRGSLAPRPPTIDGASGQSVAKPRRGGADIRPREWPDAPPKRAVRAWAWATVRSRREKTAPPPCPRASGRCGVNESMWTSGKNLT